MMKRTKWILTIGLVLFAAYPFTNTKAQLKNLGAFMAAGKSDAEKLFEAYLSPYLNAFGASMTGGWYNTAKPHKLGGVDLTITFNTAIVPKDIRTFDIDALGLQSLQRDPAANNLSPTVAGKRNNGSQMDYMLSSNGFSFTGPAFKLPQGTGFPYIPTPMAQAGVGLFKGTEIIGRWVPTFNLGQGSIGLWGIGLKHNIDQWIPGLKKVPVLNISVLGGYTKLNGKVGFTVRPGDIGLTSSLPDNTWNGQNLQLTTTSFTADLLVSANLPVVCFFGGFGFARTKTNLKLNGNFPVAGINTSTGQPEVNSLKDPIDFQVKNQDGGLTKPRVDLGMRIKLGVLTIHFDYTRANYNVATAGIGLSFR